MTFFAASILAMTASFLVAVTIVFTPQLHGHLTMDSHVGVQKLHKTATPRVGGVALFFGILVGGISLPPQAQGLWAMIVLSALPAFLFGFLEDITKRVGVTTRLLATICAGLLFSTLTGYQIDHVGILGVDYILGFHILSLLFTAFAIGGIANAINIIDGVNGLASGTSIIVLIGFGLVAWHSGDLEMLGICVTCAAAVGGFFLLNFPMGKLFLGDAGAYTIGFILAAVAVALPARNPEISPLIGLLALSYPVTETIASIHRRMKREGTHPGQPDRLHLHSLVYRSRALRLANLVGLPKLRNAMTGFLLLSVPAVSVALMVVFQHDSTMIWCSMAVIATGYTMLYRKVALLPPLGHQFRLLNPAANSGAA